MEQLRALRGIGKELFRELGGGEQFLRNERNNFARSQMSCAGDEPNPSRPDAFIKTDCSE